LFGNTDKHVLPKTHTKLFNNCAIRYVLAAVLLVLDDISTHT